MKRNANDSDPRSVTQLHAGTGHASTESLVAGRSTQHATAQRRPEGFASVLPAALAELRRRWRAAVLVFTLVLAPTLAYGLLAVPAYQAQGVLQVSAQGGLASANPLAELAGTGAAAEVNTEVQILHRHEFLLGVFKQLRLHVVDADQPGWLSSDIEISLAGKSPVRVALRKIRAALGEVEIDPERFEPIAVRVVAVDETRLDLIIDPHSEQPRTVHGEIGQLLDLGRASVRFERMPLAPGQSFEIELVGDGLLLERLLPQLRIAALGTTREATNLVQVEFTDPDRHTAQAVVQTIMDRYLAQSVRWQTQGASASALFVRERLEEVRTRLTHKETALSNFAQSEHAVQLDTQARVNIEKSASLETTRLEIDLQAQVLAGLARSLRKSNRSGSANLTASLVQDPVLRGAIAALTEAETEHTTLGATLQPDHPQLAMLAARIGLQQRKVGALVRATRKNLAANRSELDRRLAETNAALAAYPEREMQLARLVRDLEVSQRLYAFLLERAQEAEILEASTTTDKRTVDHAALPHRRATPNRVKLLVTGAVFAVLLAFASVYLARVFQRHIPTVEAAKELVPYPTYGSIPLATGRTSAPRLSLEQVWKAGAVPICDAYAALCASVSLIPMREQGRGRIILVTSSCAGEGKSTIAANLAVGLGRSGSRVLVIDLDLRRPVQHRIWGVRRAKGYSDLVADQAEFELTTVTATTPWGVHVLPAGTRQPDTLGALLSPRLGALLDDSAMSYDYVVVDGAPTFVGDAPVLAQHADLLLLAVRPGVVERRRLLESVEALSRMGGAKGVVFNGVSRSSSDDYYAHSEYSHSEPADVRDDDGSPGDSTPSGASPERRAVS